MNYRVKYTASEVAAAISRTVSSLQTQGILAQDTVYIVLMNGGTWFASHVFDRLEEPHNEVYYVKLHSYEGTSSGIVHWDYLPEMDLKGRHIVVLDDICDTGKTDTAFYQYLKTCRPLSVTFFTLLKRTTTALPEDIPLYACIEDNSEDFFVGCGLDDNAQGRLLPYIGIVEP